MANNTYRHGQGYARAKSNSDAKVKAVIVLREKLGIGDGDMETGTLNIRREYERDERGNQGALKHFLVRRSVTIRQRNLTRFDEFLDALVASSVMDLSFSYESSRIHEIRAETRLKELALAKDKAEVVGATLGKIISINENAPGDPRRNPMSNGSAQITFGQGAPSVDFATDRFVPGAMSVRMTVYATFEIQ